MSEPTIRTVQVALSVLSDMLKPDVDGRGEPSGRKAHTPRIYPVDAGNLTLHPARYGRGVPR